MRSSRTRSDFNYELKCMFFVTFSIHTLFISFCLQCLHSTPSSVTSFLYSHQKPRYPHSSIAYPKLVIFAFQRIHEKCRQFNWKSKVSVNKSHTDLKLCIKQITLAKVNALENTQFRSKWLIQNCSKTQHWREVKLVQSSQMKCDFWRQLYSEL